MLAHLNAFVQNPFYSYYVNILQKTADEATQSVFRGFVGERDFCAILEREQTIGAAATFLRFAQLSKDDLTLLQTEYQKLNQ